MFLGYVEYGELLRRRWKLVVDSKDELIEACTECIMIASYLP